MEDKENKEHVDSIDKVMDNMENLDTGNNSAVLFERSRIKALAEQRESVQKKTFTKWVNSHLAKSKDRMQIEDLFTDLQDGKALLKLLEILSGEKMPSITKGKLRIHCIENVTKSIKFLNEQHVYLENLGAHDIVDGNPTLTLGLIWTIILRFQIQDAAIDEHDGKKTSKESLLLWCQMKTAGYNNVNIRNFTGSWKDGLAFNALLHKHRPEVVDYITLSKANPVENLSMAFEIAEREFGVPQLLEAKDIILDQPEEKSIMTYVGILCSALNKMKSNKTQVKRLGNVISEAIKIEKLISMYELDTRDLLEWIQEKIEWMENLILNESLPGVQSQLADFTNYRLDEKPPRFQDRGLLEMRFFEIQSKLRSDNRKYYIAPEGKLISDINRAWENLEKSEHKMELKLYEELIRQQKLEQLGNHFNRKAQMREAWLQENDNLVHKNIFGDDLVTVVAAIKKHEALEGDILAHEERINALGYIADDLKRENYYKIEEVEKRYDYIVHLWKTLLEDLQLRRQRLDKCRDIQLILHESDYLNDWMKEIVVRLSSRDFGKHMLGVENLLEKHKILMSDIRSLEHRVQETSEKILTADYDPEVMDKDFVESRNEQFLQNYQNLLSLSEKREKELNCYKEMWKYIEDMSSDKEWAKEIIQLLQSPDLGHDLTSVERLIRKYEQLVSDVNIRKDLIYEKLDTIKQYADSTENPHRQQSVNKEILEMNEILKTLEKLSEFRRQQLDESHKYHQLLADIDDENTLIFEVCRLFECSDVGDKLSVTEFYLKQFEEQMFQVKQLEDVMKELFDRKTTLDLDDHQDHEVKVALSKLRENFDELLELAKNRRHLLLNNKEKFHLISNFDTIENWIVAKEKLLVTLSPSEEFDELNIVKHRFSCFEDELKINSVKISDSNNISTNLIKDNHPESQLISEKQNDLNSEWNKLVDLSEKKKKELQLAVDYSQFLVECQETCTWIKEKMKLLEWTDDIKDDLDGIMQLQRRLGSLQRDVQAIEANVKHLNKEADNLKELKPNAESVIENEITMVNELWEELQIMLQERDKRLNSSTELQKFFQDLDSFDDWMKKMQTQVATQDIAKDLAEAEKFAAAHEEVKEEISCREPDYIRLLKYGREVTHSHDEPQYINFNERLNTLEKDWATLEKMWRDKYLSLNQSKEAQTFLRDAHQVDSILTKQETFLTKAELPNTYEATEVADREFEAFKASVISNQPKIESVIEYGESLLSTNALSDRIRNRCDQIKDRCDAINDKLNKRSKALKDHLDLQMYLEDVMDLEEWIAEKLIVAMDTSYRDTKDISTRYNRFRDFERELEANKERVDQVIQAGTERIENNPHQESAIEPKIIQVESQWNELLTSVKEKSSQMEEANREIIFDESTKAMMTWVTEISTQIITTEEVTEEYGLVEINEKLKDQEEKDRQLEQKLKMLCDIEQHAEKLIEQYPERQEQFEQIQQEVKVRLTEVEAPLTQRRDKLSQHKRVQQFLRDVEDEKEWIIEKTNVINNLKVIPESLQICLQRIRRLKTMGNEIDNHASRISDLNDEGHEMINDNHPSSDKFEAALDELNNLWTDLNSMLDDCMQFFDECREIQEYLSEANESEGWMGDREIELMGEDKTKDEEGALKAMRKHEELINIINSYGSNISKLASQYQSILHRGLPDSHIVAQRQERVDKMYASLLEMCLERRLKIEDLIQFYHLYLSIQDLEEWIAERTVVASSNETGSELEHCRLFRDRFKEFAIETNDIGGPRVADADEMCDKLISLGHQESPKIAQWKDRINEAWADLLELIETRIQLLKAAHDFFTFMSESSELLDLIREKIHLIPDISLIGRDAKSVATSQRKHQAFATEIERLHPFILNALATADNLLPLYCGDKEKELIDRKNDLQKLWLLLQKEYDNHNNALMDNSDLYKFYNMVRELSNWMNIIEIQLNVEDKARDVCGVELIISDHRSLKAEIDSRDENKTICLTLGRTLINRKHPKRNDVRRKCADIVTKHFNILEKWTERQEFLKMILEVYQFAREAAVAEAWLIAQESQFSSDDCGDTLNETLNLLQKHLVLERNLGMQKERFEALRKLTLLEEIRSSLTNEKKQEKSKDRQKRLNKIVAEFKTPPPTPEPVRKSPDIIQPVEIQEDEIVVPVVKKVEQSSLPQEIEPVVVKAATPPPSSLYEEVISKTTKTGTLHRKHEWENPTKKASSRKWNELYVVIDGEKLSFYKERKYYEDDKKQHTFKHEKPLDLKGSVAAVATTYKKRSNVFKLRLQNGAEYLFESASPTEMHEWIDKINIIGGVDTSQTKYSTLPVAKSNFDGSEPTTEKKKFPTLGRKQKS